MRRIAAATAGEFAASSENAREIARHPQAAGQSSPNTRTQLPQALILSPVDQGGARRTGGESGCSSTGALEAGPGGLLSLPHRDHDAEHGFDRRCLRQQPCDFRHATVAGQVATVLVDDNMRVSKGDLLVELDREPFQVQVDIKKAAVVNAEADLNAAEAQVRATLGMVRSQRWRLQTAIEQVDNQVALLRARVAALHSKEATRDRALADLARAELLFKRGAIPREELDQRREAGRVAEALAHQAMEEVSETRVTLGLPPRPETGELFRRSRRAQPELLWRASGARGTGPGSGPGRPASGLLEPHTQAGHCKLHQPRQGREHRPDSGADCSRGAGGAAGRRQTAPGPAGPCRCRAQPSLLHDPLRDRRRGHSPQRQPRQQRFRGAKPHGRSLAHRDRIDANFKETQLADLRIGHRVRCEVDMYGGRREFEGRITGFTMGTGQTLALLPPQNATGNYVKIVQRLPVRVELTDYDPDKIPLFVGLLVVPYVYYKEPPEGPHAGDVLQPTAIRSRAPSGPSSPERLPKEAPIARDFQR